jgi:hypothetical protein
MINRLFVLGLVASSVLLGCGGGAGDGATDGAASAGDTGAGGTGGTSGTGGTGGVGPATALVRGVRFGHFAKAIGDFDVCLISNASAVDAYVGPLFKAKGNAAGLAFGQVSSYTMTEVGNFRFRFVAPNAADCTTPLLNFGNQELPFNVNGDIYMSVGVKAAAMGSTAPAGQLTAGDPSGEAAAGNVVLRLTNLLVEVAGSAPALDFGPVKAGVFTSTFKNLTNASLGGFPAPSAVTFEARATGMTTAFLTATVTLIEKVMYSGWVYGELGSTTNPPKLAICANTGVAGAFSNCKTY